MGSGIFTSSTTTSACYILADWTRQICSSTAHSGGTVTASKDSSLSAAIEAYLLHMHACGYAESSILCYRVYLERLAVILNNVGLAAVDSNTLDRALALMKRQTGLAETTLNKIRSAYRSFFQWAVNSGRCFCNPTILLTFARTESFPTIPITSDETELLLKTISQSGKPIAARDDFFLLPMRLPD